MSIKVVKESDVFEDEPCMTISRQNVSQVQTLYSQSVEDHRDDSMICGSWCDLRLHAVEASMTQVHLWDSRVALPSLLMRRTLTESGAGKPAVCYDQWTSGDVIIHCLD